MAQKEHDIKTIKAFVGGAGRGARLMLPAVREYNDRSERLHIQPFYVDPLPGRARNLALDAQAIGVPAESAERGIEEFLREHKARQRCVVILNLDRPKAVADSLRATLERQAPVLAYMLIRTPSGELYGLSLAQQAHEEKLKNLAALFFEELANVVARSGASNVVGDRGFPEHVAAEPRYRAWFADHMRNNIGKLVAGLEPESSPFAMTVDGQSTLCVTLCDHRTGWMEPRALASEVVTKPVMPIIRGEDFAIGEIGPDGIRIHQVRLRETDGEVSLRGSVVIDPAAFEDAEKQREIAEEAIRKAARQTISRTQPAFPTD